MPIASKRTSARRGRSVCSLSQRVASRRTCNCLRGWIDSNGSRCAPGIDARGLHKTNLAALREALINVACDGAICLSDGFSLGDIGYEHRAVIKGDSTSAAIAAASVLAKETRDRYMRRVGERNPGWGFAQHVGYASPEHRSAIERLGVTPLHRLSFQSAAYQQLTLG